MTITVSKHIIAHSTAFATQFRGRLGFDVDHKSGEHVVGVMTTQTLVTNNSRKRRLLRSRRLITG